MSIVKKRSYSVVYLEDDQIYPEVIKEKLDGTNFTLMSCVTSVEQLKQCSLSSKGTIDIALLDVMIGNDEIIHHLDDIKCLSGKTTLVLLTTIVNGEKLRIYEENGIQHYISKKSVNQDLLPCLNAAVKKEPFASLAIASAFGAVDNRKLKLDLAKEYLRPQEYNIFLKRVNKLTTKEIIEQSSLSPETIWDYNKKIKKKINEMIEDNPQLGLDFIKNILDLPKMFGS